MLIVTFQYVGEEVYDVEDVYDGEDDEEGRFFGGGLNREQEVGHVLLLPHFLKSFTVHRRISGRDMSEI